MPIQKKQHLRSVQICSLRAMQGIDVQLATPEAEEQKILQRAEAPLCKNLIVLNGTSQEKGVGCLMLAALFSVRMYWDRFQPIVATLSSESSDNLFWSMLPIRAVLFVSWLIMCWIQLFVQYPERPARRNLCSWPCPLVNSCVYLVDLLLIGLLLVGRSLVLSKFDCSVICFGMYI